MTATVHDARDTMTADRVSRAREASSRLEVVDPYVLELARVADLMSEYFAAQDAVEEASFAGVECPSIADRRNLLDRRLRGILGLGGSPRTVVRLVRESGRDHEPPSGWQERTLSRLPPSQLREPWYARLWSWLWRPWP